MKMSTERNPEILRPAAAALLSLALALPLAASHTVAGNRDGRVDRSIPVSWADLDLNRPAGLETLYLRLTRATTAVCSPREDIRNFAMNRDRDACLETAMDNAVRSLGHRGLEGMHASRTGRSVGPGQSIARR